MNLVTKAIYAYKRWKYGLPCAEEIEELYLEQISHLNFKDRYVLYCYLTHGDSESVYRRFALSPERFRKGLWRFYNDAKSVK
jgi:hypothetical protein